MHEETRPFEVKRIADGGESTEEDIVAVEEPLQIVLNGITLAYLMRLPGSDLELAAGFCLSEGLIAGAGQIDMVAYCNEGDGPADIEADDEAGGNTVRVIARDVTEGGRFEGRVIRTGCGGADLDRDLDLDGLTVESDVSFPVEAIVKAAARLEEGQPVFKSTGGTHGAGIFDVQGEVLVVREDVGRHNAVDKALGYLLLSGGRFDDKGMILSGRLSYEMVLKAARAGVPLICSVSAPTSLGVEVGRRTGVTMIGFLRGSAFNVYSGAHRVISP